MADPGFVELVPHHELRSIFGELVDLVKFVCSLFYLKVITESEFDQIRSGDGIAGQTEALADVIFRTQIPKILLVSQILKRLKEKKVLGRLEKFDLGGNVYAGNMKIGFWNPECWWNWPCSFETDARTRTEQIKKRFRDAIAQSKIFRFMPMLKDVKFCDDLVALDDATKQTSLYACLTKEIGVFPCFKAIIAKFQELCSKKHAWASHEQKWTLEEFLSQRDDQGTTIAHLAAKRSLVAIFQLLRKSCSTNTFNENIFLEDNNGNSVLKLLYLYTPATLLETLDYAISFKNKPTDGNFEVNFEFRFLIGKMQQPCNTTSNQQTSKRCVAEMDLLAKLIYANRSGADAVLKHVVVKSFLEFKWAKMKFWFFLLYVLQICCHIGHTLFVIQVFLVDCRYGSTFQEINSSVISLNPVDLEATTAPRHMAEYLFGDFERRLVEAFDVTNGDSFDCNLSESVKFWAYSNLVTSGILFGLKEIVQIGFKIQAAKNVCSGLKPRVGVENVLQLISTVLVIWVSSVAFCGPTSAHYSVASFSILISGGLTLLKLGHLFRLGIYIQMLGKVVKKCFKLMGLYAVVFLVFSISFSIMFTYKRFQTLPQSVTTVLVMMIGEFEYGETFGDGPYILFTGQVIYSCFAILMTIILMNLLIGIIVSDVNELKAKSEVVELSLKVEQLYFLETNLIRSQKFLLPLAKTFDICRRILYNTQVFQDRQNLDIFVVSDQDQTRKRQIQVKSFEESGYSFNVSEDFIVFATDPYSHDSWSYTTPVLLQSLMVVKSIIEIPKYLQQELLDFAKKRMGEDDNDYPLNMGFDK